MKESDVNLPIRFDQAEHLLKALQGLPEEDRRTITHQDLVRRVTLIRNAWVKAQLERKTTQAKVLKSKLTKKQ